MSMSTDPRVRLTFAKRAGPDRTHWLEIEAPADAEPTSLYADLRAAGWTERDAPLAPHPAYDERTFRPLGYVIQERTFTRRGSERFAMWGAGEARAWLPEARRILRAHGFARVPVWHKTLEDML